MAANEWSEKVKMIVTIAVVLIVNVAMGAGLYYVHAEWKKLDAQHKQLLTQKKNLEGEVAQGANVDAEYKLLSERFEKQSKLLPDSDELEKLIEDITKIASSTHCTEKGFIRKTAGGGDAGKGPMGATASYVREVWGTKWQGDFMGFTKLLNEIEEHFPRFIAFENLSIQAKSQGLIPTGTPHDISVELVTYRYNVKK